MDRTLRRGRGRLGGKRRRGGGVGDIERRCGTKSSKDYWWPTTIFECTILKLCIYPQSVHSNSKPKIQIMHIIHNL